MQQPTFQITTLEENDDYGKFIFEPLEQGFGHTLGVALRRTLLTSVKGAGVSQVKIDGIKHKFSTLKGMREDIIDFTLNLKQLRIKYDGDEPVELTLDVTGQKEIKASDIQAPALVQITNPELVLAHLADRKSKLKAKIIVETGYGYILAEERKTNTLGVIPLDTAYTPVLRVKYEVKETRVGQRTDLDKLILEVWTNGTVSPSSVISHAAEVMINYFNQIIHHLFI